MSVHFICGKPGGGKSLYGMKLILEELRFGNRLVVTNLALNLPRLNEYLQKTYPKEDIILRDRIKLLDEESCKKFWLFRQFTGSVNDVPWNEPGRGAFIVLDELHLFFNAREWMHTGTDCLHYLSQHRKLGDDVICITQHVGNVDKQFRSVAQDFSLIVNGFKQKLGLFRGLPMFHRYTYPAEPNGTKTEPDDTGHFRLDAAGIASCYDTAAGIGVHGRGADKAERKKGLSPFWFPVIALAVIVAIMFGVKGCNKAVQVAMSGDKQDSVAHPPPASQSDAKQGGVVAPLAQETGQPIPPPQQNNRVDAVGVAADRPVVVQKLLRGDGRARIVLSDGRTFDSGVDEELEVVLNHKVRISGQWHYFKRPDPRAPRPQETPHSMPAVEEKAAPLPAPPAPSESSWEMHADGVERLKDFPRGVGDLFK